MRIYVISGWISQDSVLSRLQKGLHKVFPISPDVVSQSDYIHIGSGLLFPVPLHSSHMLLGHTITLRCRFSCEWPVGLYIPVASPSFCRGNLSSSLVLPLLCPYQLGLLACFNILPGTICQIACTYMSIVLWLSWQHYNKKQVCVMDQ